MLLSLEISGFEPRTLIQDILGKFPLSSFSGSLDFASSDSDNACSPSTEILRIPRDESDFDPTISPDFRGLPIFSMFKSIDKDLHTVLRSCDCDSKTFSLGCGIGPDILEREADFRTSSDIDFNSSGE